MQADHNLNELQYIIKSKSGLISMGFSANASSLKAKQMSFHLKYKFNGKYLMTKSLLFRQFILIPNHYIFLTQGMYHMAGQQCRYAKSMLKGRREKCSVTQRLLKQYMYSFQLNHYKLHYLSLNFNHLRHSYAFTQVKLKCVEQDILSCLFFLVEINLLFGSDFFAIDKSS